MSTEDVGMNELLKPSPNWKHRTDVCLVIPTMSASGIIIGIIVAACPVDDGIIKLTIIYTYYTQ